MKVVLFIAVIFLNLTCITQERLSDSKTFKKVFSEYELKDAQIIFDFFNSKICENLEDISLDSCYHKFLNELTNSDELGNIQLNISFDEQLKMYEKLDSSTFSNFWHFDRMWLTRDRSDTLKSITYKYHGSYAKFLKKISKKNKAVKYYFEGFEMSGDIGPTMTASILMKYDQYETKDVRVKFIIAMHYLTLNDQLNRKEKY